MLNKRTSDFIFIGMVLLVIIGVFVIRVLLVGQIDQRIESTEASNIQLTNSIRAVERIVENHRDKPIPSMVEMHQMIPNRFDPDYLWSYVTAHLELAGIDSSLSTNRRVIVAQTPYNYPQGSPLRALSNNVDLYLVTVTFNTDDLTEIDEFIDELMDNTQLFIVQRIEYTIPALSSIMNVRIELAAVYYK